jgi:hypothetical protein
MRPRKSQSYAQSQTGGLMASTQGRPATVAELKTIRGVTNDFIVQQMTAGATLAEARGSAARDSFEHLVASAIANGSTRSQAVQKVRREQPKLYADYIAGANVKQQGHVPVMTDAERANAKKAFEGIVAEKRRAGSKSPARDAAMENPELHRAYIAAINPGKRLA